MSRLGEGLRCQTAGHCWSGAKFSPVCGHMREGRAMWSALGWGCNCLILEGLPFRLQGHLSARGVKMSHPCEMLVPVTGSSWPA